MKNRLSLLLPAFILLIYPNISKASPQSLKNESPFPKISIGVAGLAYRSTNEVYQEYLFTDNNGWGFGYQADVELRVLANEYGAAYIIGNLTRPTKDLEVTQTTVYGSDGTTFTYSYLFDYRSVGTRFARKGNSGCRIWIDGGATYLKLTVKNDYPGYDESVSHVHGWFLGAGQAKKILPFLSIFTRIAYISTPDYNSFFNGDDNVDYRTEFGGWSGSIGLRFEL